MSNHEAGIELGPTEVPISSSKLELPEGVRPPPWHVRLRFWWLSKRHPDGHAYYFPVPEVPEGMEDAFYDPSWDDWREPRRYRWVWVALLVLVVSVASVVALAKPAPKVKQTIPDRAAFKLSVKGANGPGSQVPVSTRAPDQVFEGKAGSFQRRYLTSAGIVKLSIYCDCHTLFGLEIYDADQNLVTTPINHVGFYIGYIAYANTFQWHSLEVQADGPWKIVVRSPAIKQLVNLPQRYAFGNDAVQGPFQGGRTVEIKAKFLPLAPSESTVQVLNANGDVVQTLINRSGRFVSTVTTGLAQGPVFIAVRSAAFWTLLIKPVT